MIKFITRFRRYGATVIKIGMHINLMRDIIPENQNVEEEFFIVSVFII